MLTPQDRLFPIIIRGSMKRSSWKGTRRCLKPSVVLLFLVEMGRNTEIFDLSVHSLWLEDILLYSCRLHEFWMIVLAPLETCDLHLCTWVPLSVHSLMLGAWKWALCGSNSGCSTSFLGFCQVFQNIFKSGDHLQARGCVCLLYTSDAADE